MTHATRRTSYVERAGQWLRMLNGGTLSSTERCRQRQPRRDRQAVTFHVSRRASGRRHESGEHRVQSNISEA